MLKQIFVYGTLMEGYNNFNRYLKPYCIKVEKAYTLGELYHLPEHECPALKTGNDKVYGQLITYEDIGNKVESELDNLESNFGKDNLLKYTIVYKDIYLSEQKRRVKVYMLEDLNNVENVYINEGDWDKYNKVVKT